MVDSNTEAFFVHQMSRYIILIICFIYDKGFNLCYSNAKTILDTQSLTFSQSQKMTTLCWRNQYCDVLQTNNLQALRNCCYTVYTYYKNVFVDSFLAQKF